ncbi:ABC transporter ATP-binding protein [Demequina lutea]|uniref:ABC-type nitrate/sulfonate/bicarbonate transport system ATPase subunit n=1 Tax=Demequina lutea TaxID=431489 RepID=A0A7Y9ZB43_9MICO|nr:ABC transporter ATP-binding protein [Demequina lutea]NYI41298.1 ABC-type nitrate/sulfonate/bicarbonate transport system ATPase subunit [Demequina lutea]
MTISASTALKSGRAELKIEGVTREFVTKSSKTLALSDSSITVEPGEFLSIIGPSGCGKSTLFNIVAGLDMPTTGDIRINGESIVGEQGHVGYMLQKDLLLPWRSVLNNIIIGMEVSGMPKKRARELAMPFLEAYGLKEFAKHRPDQLSGGMRQRAALLRTILFNRDVILLDEPFGKLDAQTRATMQEWLLDVWDDFKKTVVFVTHDIDEAVYLSDRVVVMAPRPGRVIADIPIALDRPRKPAIVTSDEFIAYKNRIFSLLHTSLVPTAERTAE